MGNLGFNLGKVGVGMKEEDTGSSTSGLGLGF